MILVISRSLQSFLLLICPCEIKRKAACAQSLTHITFDPKQLLRNNTDNRVLQINTRKVISVFTSKVRNYAKLYPLLETTAQKGTPFALYCDYLYVCSLRT